MLMNERRKMFPDISKCFSLLSRSFRHKLKKLQSMKFKFKATILFHQLFSMSLSPFQSSIEISVSQFLQNLIK
jgi:hypothetical protein